jgi:hypothetical protein
MPLEARLSAQGKARDWAPVTTPPTVPLPDSLATVPDVSAPAVAAPSPTTPTAP